MERRKKGPKPVSVLCRSCGVTIDLDPYAMHPHNGGWALPCWHCGQPRIVRRNDRHRKDLLELFGEERRIAAQRQAAARTTTAVSSITALASFVRGRRSRDDAAAAAVPPSRIASV